MPEQTDRGDRRVSRRGLGQPQLPASPVRTALCGRVWRPRRRRTCPVCHIDRSICLTCDQVAVENRARRCATDEALRRLVKVCAGDWQWARRALDAAGGDVACALALAERIRTHMASAG